MLANVMRKPMPQIFKEFQGTHYDLEEYLRHDWSSAGDVKYHLGTSMDRSYPDGRRVGCPAFSFLLLLLLLLFPASPVACSLWPPSWS